MLRHRVVTDLVGFLGLAALALSGRAQTVLFEDDFSAYRPGADGAPLWQAESGTWRVVDGAFEGQNTEGHFAAVGAASGLPAWTDYTLSLRLKIVSRGDDWRDGPWLGVRTSGALSGYTVGFYGRLTALHKTQGGRQTNDTNPLAQTPTTIGDNEWHRVAVTVTGNHVRVDLDGALLLEATDKDWNGTGPVPAGGIVLAARHYETGQGTTSVLFDDVRVEAPGQVAADLVLTRATALRAALRETPSMLEFMRSRRDRQYANVPRQVLAFYYTWYGTPEKSGRGQSIHWGAIDPAKHDIEASTHYPARGAYDSHDVAVIDGHIRQAKAAGLTGFISTWWGQNGYDDRAFATLLERARLQDFKATIYWETAPGKGAAQVRQAAADLAYVLSRHGRHEAFLKVDGKPVIFVYGRVMGEVPLGAWPAILAAARAAGAPDALLVADQYSESAARVFDGVHTYNVCGWVQKKTPAELREFAARTYAADVALARQHGRLSCLTIIPGYDDTKIRKPGLNAARQDGQTYRVLWEEAAKADPDWVLITSWNEWHEGSEIEPSWEDKDTYLKLTREYAPRFTARPPAAAPAAAAAAAKPTAAQIATLRQLYAKRPIAILPDYGSSVVFWLADAGLTLRELSWDDLLAPATFNAKAFPVVVNAGGEHYVRTLDRDGDVEAALLRYLREGGLLLTVTTQPFPFYYDETGKPNVAAGRLGFPLVGSGAGAVGDVPAGAAAKGWEQPPAGVRLAFVADTQALPGVPPRTAFPEAGDLRWRPASRSLVATDDLYLPLVRLQDEAGKAYGDAVIYVEHRASEPKGGRNLYVWLRMPEVLGPNALYYDLFRLAAAKLPAGR